MADSWLKSGALKNQYPHIFSIDEQNDILVSESFRDIWGDIRRRVDVQKNLSDWEINEYENLSCTLSHIVPDGNKDQRIWSLTKSGSFSAKSFYKHLTIRKLKVVSFLLDLYERLMLLLEWLSSCGKPVEVVF